MRIGIYRILNLSSGKLYIGSSCNITKRWWEHKKGLRLGKHPNVHLQSSWDMYGEDKFEFYVVELCSPDNLLEREQHYIDVLNPEYNICKIAGNNLGIKHSDKANKDKSARQKGHTVSPETRAKISAKLMGHKQSQETKNKISIGTLGNKSALGHKLTKEAKEKIIMSKKTNKAKIHLNSLDR